MSETLREMAGNPFALLAALEARGRVTRADVAGQQGEVWLGLGFRLRGQWCVAPRDDVREIIPLPSLSRAPGAKPWLMGVANVRGSILAVADLAVFLGLARQPPQSTSRVLILNSSRLPVGLLVDEVAGYRPFTPGEQRHARVASAGAISPWLLGAFERGGEVWHAFSLHRLAAAPEFLHAGD